MYNIEVVIRYHVKFDSNLKEGCIESGFTNFSNNIFGVGASSDLYCKFRDFLNNLISDDDLTMYFYIDAFEAIDRHNIGKENRYEVSTWLKLNFNISEEDMLYFKIKYQEAFDSKFSPFSFLP